MPLKLLNPRGPGSVSDWAPVGASSGWEAVRKDTPDSTYVESLVALDTSLFDCGEGRVPLCGFVAGLLVRVRVRRTDNSSGGLISLLVDQNGTTQIAGTVTPPNGSTDWVDQTIFVRVDWTSGVRFTQVDLQTLSVGIELTTLPTSGGFDVSQLYIDVDQASSLFFYDPFSGLTPNAVVGDRAFTTLGTQPVSITVDNYLEIVDTSTLDFRYYFGPIPSLIMTERWVTEAETRFKVTAVDPSLTGASYIIFGMLDFDIGLSVNLLKINGSQYIGIYPTYKPPSDPDSYVALAPLTYLNKDLHVRVRIDRYTDPDDVGLIQVWVNYSDTPILEFPFREVPHDIPPGLYGPIFGTPPDKAATVKVDYFAWDHYKRFGYSFQDWIETDHESNRIYADNSDSEICRLVDIPPGIPAGQSNTCCLFEINDVLAVCGVYTIYPDYLSPAVTYHLALTYKAVGFTPMVEVLLQRCADLWYWNQGTLSWQAALSSVSLPSAATRTIAPVFTGITNTAPDGLVLTIRSLSGMPIGPPRIYLYHAHLTRS